MKGTLDPMTLRIGKVGLTGLRADLVRGKDGKLNLPEIPEKAPEKPGKQSPVTGKTDAGLQSVRVDEFVMSDGAVNFTDQGVPGEFHATVKDISVRVTGLSSAPGTFADVRALMTLPKGAPLRVSGKAAPLKKPAYADLELALEKLDLSTATPYSGAYLGLEIDHGELTVKSRAKVEKGKLAAENRIRVDQLEFGKSVKSDQATILPVQMIVDIMRDRNGDIVLDLPVSARTDDENMTGTIVKQAVGEVIFPPSSPVRNISFAACSAELDSDAQGRLRRLAGALQERPAMKVTAVGYVDREVDGKRLPGAGHGREGRRPTARRGRAVEAARRGSGRRRPGVPRRAGDRGSGPGCRRDTGRVRRPDAEGREAVARRVRAGDRLTVGQFLHPIPAGHKRQAP